MQLSKYFFSGVLLKESRDKVRRLFQLEISLCLSHDSSRKTEGRIIRQSQWHIRLKPDSSPFKTSATYWGFRIFGDTIFPLMNSKKYYTASIWLGILPLLVVSLVWAIGVYTQPLSESAFLLPHSFASAINAFFFPYVLSVLWIRVVELSGSSRKLALLQKLWWVGLVLMVLFWVVIAFKDLLIQYLPTKPASAYPPLESNKHPQLSVDRYFYQLLFKSVHTTLITLAGISTSILICVSIVIYRKSWLNLSLKLFSGFIFLTSLVIGLESLLLVSLTIITARILVIPYFLDPPDIYVGEFTEAYTLVYTIELLPVCILIIGIAFRNKKRLFTVSSGFGLLALLVCIKALVSSKETDITLYDVTNAILNSSYDFWAVYLGLTALVYWHITWSKQIIQWLAYLHLAITGLIALRLSFQKHIRLIYMSFDSTDSKLEYGVSIALFFLIFIAVSQLLILINYWLSNHYKAKNSVT